MLETLQKVLYIEEKRQGHLPQPMKGATDMPAERSASREGYLHENYRYFHLRDTAGQERDFHFHDFDKLVILISGRVDYAVEDRVYALRPWDVLLVRRHTIHKAVIDMKEPYERIIIYLDRKYFDRVMPEAGLMGCFDSAGAGGRCLLAPEGEELRLLRQALDSYEQSSGGSLFGEQAMRDTLMMQLLIQVNRIAAVAPEGREKAYDPKIETVLSYINENLSRELSVEALAEKVYLSRYHFMRLFKAQTGSTVHAYVRQKRLLYAARLIRQGVNANKAAVDSGFADYSSFHRAFRECFGTSPGKLKR